MTDLRAWIDAAMEQEKALLHAEPDTWHVDHHVCRRPGWGFDCDDPCSDKASCEAGECLHVRIEGSANHSRGTMIIYDEGGHDDDDAAHIAYWDPQQAAREHAMKETILAHHQPNPGAGQPAAECTCGAREPCATVRAVAASFPGYVALSQDPGLS